MHPFSFNLLELISYNISLKVIKHSGMNLGIAIGKQEDNNMPGLKAMFLDEGSNGNIRCRFICYCCKVESYVHSNARLFSAIEKTHPDVVVMDLELYARIDGIETSRRIRSQFDVPVMYV
jgi:CheY-like chemotaxis protein